MSVVNDITGQRFGKLVALYRSPEAVRPMKWVFRCDCGTEKSIRKSHVTSGLVTSCKCKSSIYGVNYNKSPLHIRWRNMHSRCYDPNNKRYHRYGGRGIAVAPEWHDFGAFKAWAESNGYEKTLELDRRDNSKGYAPGNCRFVPRRVNIANRDISIHVEVAGEKLSLPEAASKYGLAYSALAERVRRGESGDMLIRPTKKYTFFGEPMTMTEAEARFGIKERTIRFRIKRGLTPDQAVTRPTNRGKPLTWGIP